MYSCYSFLILFSCDFLSVCSILLILFFGMFFVSLYYYQFAFFSMVYILQYVLVRFSKFHNVLVRLVIFNTSCILQYLLVHYSTFRRFQHVLARFSTFWYVSVRFLKSVLLVFVSLLFVFLSLQHFLVFVFFVSFTYVFTILLSFWYLSCSICTFSLARSFLFFFLAVFVRLKFFFCTFTYYYVQVVHVLFQYLISFFDVLHTRSQCLALIWYYLIPTCYYFGTSLILIWYQFSTNLVLLWY